MESTTHEFAGKVSDALQLDAIDAAVTDIQIVDVTIERLKEILKKISIAEEGEFLHSIKMKRVEAICLLEKADAQFKDYVNIFLTS